MLPLCSFGISATGGLSLTPGHGSWTPLPRSDQLPWEASAGRVGSSWPLSPSSLPQRQAQTAWRVGGQSCEAASARLPGGPLIVSLPPRGGIRSLLPYQHGSLASCRKGDLLGDSGARGSGAALLRPVCFLRYS